MDRKETVDALFGLVETLIEWAQMMRDEAELVGTAELWSATLDLERAERSVFSAVGWLDRHIYRYEEGRGSEEAPKRGEGIGEASEEAGER